VHGSRGSEYTTCAGTAIEIAGDSTRTVFEREVSPIMQQATHIWPAEVQTYEAFELHAGLVQSRAFHMLQENWITGSAQEGEHILWLLRSAVCVPSDTYIYVVMVQDCVLRCLHISSDSCLDQS